MRRDPYLSPTAREDTLALFTQERRLKPHVLDRPVAQYLSDGAQSAFPGVGLLAGIGRDQRGGLAGLRIRRQEGRCVRSIPGFPSLNYLQYPYFN